MFDCVNQNFFLLENDVVEVKMHLRRRKILLVTKKGVALGAYIYFICSG